MNNPTITPQVVPSPFHNFCMSIGAIPTSYKDSLDYYETLLWLIKFLDETVLPAVNTNGNAVTELQTLYIELKNFIDNYFENLDVQEEINNKLDEMTTDGTLNNLIGSYINPYLAQFNTRLDEQDLKIDSLENINPIPVSSVSDMTDTTKIYVLTSDGYWYYYNGTTWTRGGVYQAPVNTDDVDKCVNFLENYIYTNETLDQLYSSTDGEITSFSNWATIDDYIDIDSISAISVPLWSGAGCVVFYDENKNFISALQGSGQYTSTGQTFSNLNNAPLGTKYIRCSYAYKIKGVSYPPTITTKLSKLINDVNIKIGDNTSEIRDGIMNLAYINNKYINTNGEIVSNNVWKCSKDFIPIENISKLYIPLWSGASCIAFYNASKEFISGVSGNGPYPDSGQHFDNLNEAPAGSVYIKISYNYNKNGVSYPPTIISKLNQIYNHSPLLKWNNKICAFLGDSITAGTGTTNGNRYWEYLHNMIGIESHGYGVSGAKISGLYTQAETMTADLDSIDCIFVFAGTNDFFHGTPLGEWYTTSEETVIINKNTQETAQREMRTFIENDTTLKGSINKLLNYLKSNYPSKQIIVMTPLHRGYAEFSNTNIQYSEMYQNRIGLYFEDYINVIREACSIWSVPCIDLYKNSGLFPLTEDGSIYFNNSETDRLHPNALGHKRLANVIVNELNKITCEFIDVSM